MDQIIGMYGSFLMSLLCVFIPLVLSVLSILALGKKQATEEYQKSQALRRETVQEQSSSEDIDIDSVLIKNAAQAKTDKNRKENIEKLTSPRRQCIIIYSLLTLSTLFLASSMLTREGIHLTNNHIRSVLELSASLIFCILALFQITRVVWEVIKIGKKHFKQEINI